MPMPFRALLRSAALLGALCLALPADAQPARAQRLAAAFFAWAETNDAANAEIAVARNGDLLLGRAADGLAGSPRLLASLSKSVTAQCVSGLVQGRRLRWDSTLAQLLGWTGPAGAITVASLITQSAGLADDRTQPAMPLWFDGFGDWRMVAGWGESLGAGGFHYNNENYALLGTVIERVTGQPYEVACNGVLPDAMLAPEVAVYGPMGGLQAALGDYAVFQSLLWGNRPADGPLAELGGGVVYGLGMYGRPSGDGWIWWHLGMLCLPERREAASYALVMRDGWTVAVAVDSCPGIDAIEALDRALWEAFGNE